MRYSPTLDFLLEGQNRIILGDLNAHHDSWFSEFGCYHRGNMFADQIDGTAFCIANEKCPTRITANCRSSPDVTIIGTQHLSANTSWSSHIALNSDHLPIIIKIDKSSDFIMSEERTFINFKKADWTRFRDLCEAQFSQLPTPKNICGQKSFQ